MNKVVAVLAALFLTCGYVLGEPSSANPEPVIENVLREQSAGHEMGKLEFTNLRIEMLGPEAAFVRGEFHLTMSDGKTPHGLFTLIFRKFPEGWKIVHDHSAGE